MTDTRDRLTELAEEYVRMAREDRMAAQHAKVNAELELIRRAPRHTSFADVRNLPALIAPFNIEVPGNYWMLVAWDTVEVACPCGQEPQMRSGKPVECVGPDCPRAYLYTGRDVLVAFSPVGTEPIREPDPDES